MEAMEIGEHLLVVSGPSGVGKTTLVRGLLKRHPRLTLSISYTTRAPRGAEKDGVDYHFVDRPRFEAMIEVGSFAEHAEVHGNLYGTTRAVVEEAARDGRDVIFDIDYQGAEQLKSAFPSAWAVLIAPPNLEVLERRLRGRGTDAEAVVARRMEKACFELSKAASFDFIILNDELEASRAELDAIYLAMQQRRRRQSRGRGALFSTESG